jgi:microcystin-dependent protein
MEIYLGQIVIFAGNFAPRNFMLCQGQILPISQYTALFSLLGTYYGGDGRTTFALPDLRGTTAIQQGQGPGLSERVLGETGGSPTVTLTMGEMPAHSHVVNANSASGSTSDPTNNFPGVAVDAGSGNEYPIYTSTAPNGNFNMMTVGAQGGNQPHQNMPPYLGVNFIICVNGYFPARN